MNQFFKRNSPASEVQKPETGQKTGEFIFTKVAEFNNKFDVLMKFIQICRMHKVISTTVKTYVIIICEVKYFGPHPQCIVKVSVRMRLRNYIWNIFGSKFQCTLRTKILA